MDLSIFGVRRVMRSLRKASDGLSGHPLAWGMRQATMLVARAARILAPVDTGRLRASITPEVEMWGNEVIGVVGSNVAYAPFMELGTRPHWPPISALEVWARRHGVSAYLVARAIARRGLAPRKYLERALRQSAARVYRLIGHAVTRIVEE